MMSWWTVRERRFPLFGFAPFFKVFHAQSGPKETPMTIRRAQAQDQKRIGELLDQVHDIHARARPDIFRVGRRKYPDAELEKRLADAQNPVFVYEDENGAVQGYVFCELQETQGHPSLAGRRVLYLDDLCVNAACRGQHIGKRLYEYVLEYARREQCDSLTLNVWQANESASGFYRKLGLAPLKTLMEQRLS